MDVWMKYFVLLNSYLGLDLEVALLRVAEDAVLVLEEGEVDGPEAPRPEVEDLVVDPHVVLDALEAGLLNEESALQLQNLQRSTSICWPEM